MPLSVPPNVVRQWEPASRVALLRMELQRLERRRRKLEALGRFLRAVEPYGSEERYGAVDSLRLFFIALTETRAARQRRHDRMSAVARKSIAVGQAIAMMRRSLANLRAARAVELHDPLSVPLPVECPESERSAVW